MPAVIEEVTPVVDTLDEATETALDQAATETEQTTDTETTTEAPKDDATSAAEAETVVTIGDETRAEEVADNATIRQMRQAIRERDRQIKELQRQHSPVAQKLGKKPTLADFDYDEEKFAPALAEWLRKEQDVAAEQQRIERETQEAQQQFQGRLQAYEAQKVALKMPGIEDAEDAVRAELNEHQQAAIIKYAKNPALVVAALGANPGKLKEFAGTKDLGEFVYKLANVEGMLKVTKRQNIPEPEKRLQVETTSAATAEGTLDRLRAEAEKTGDYSKVHAYRKKMRQEAA